MLTHPLRLSVLARNSETFRALNAASSQGFARRRKDAKGLAAPAGIKVMPTRELASQTVFARVLNVTPGRSANGNAERGRRRPKVNRPSGAALKLLTLVEKKGMMAVA